MRITDKYTFFWNGPFSNWASSVFKLDGIRYSCAEQYLMYWKALTFKDVEASYQILSTHDPKLQKALGRRVKNFDEKVWADESFDIMVRGLYGKFTQNKEYKEFLLKTPDTHFVEASPYDLIWGVGLMEDDDRILDPKNWRGENRLGNTLNKVRDIIRKKHEI